MANVGKYVYSAGGTEVDAVSVVTPGVPLPNIDSVNGVEVIIHDVGELFPVNMISDPAEVLTAYKIFLLLWGTGTGAELNAATKRALELFPGAEAVETVTQDNQINALVQTQVNIPGNSFIDGSINVPITPTIQFGVGIEFIAGIATGS